jgi:hypothetical protein
MLARFRRRPGLTQPHRSRRVILATIAIAGLIALVVGEVAADVSNSGMPSALLQERGYVAAVVPIIDESTALVPWLREIRDDAPKLGRQGLFEALGRLVTGSVQVQEQLSSLGIPGPSRHADELLRAVFAERVRASRMLAGAVASALTGRPSARATALARLQAVGSEVRGSDAAYARFLRAVPKKAREYTVRLPASSWTAAAPWTAAALTSYVTTLTSDAALLLRHDLTILDVTVQPPVLRITPTTTSTTTTTTTTTSTTTTTTTTTTIPGQSTTSTVPAKPTTTTTSTSTTTTTTTLQVPPANTTSWLAPTRHLTAVVVVADAGNVDERGVVIRAALVPIVVPPKPSAGKSTKGKGKGKHRKPVVPPRPAFVRHDLGRLAAGTSVEVQLPTFRVKPGFLYELTVTISAPGRGPGMSDTKSVRIEIV